MMFVNHSFHELIHSGEGQIGLWLPLLSQQLHHKDTEETLNMYPEVNEDWKALFIEALQIPSFNPQDHVHFTFADRHTATLVNRGKFSYKCARTFKPILPNSATYFEVEVRQNYGGVMIGLMPAKQPLEFAVPTQNFYHGWCVGYTFFKNLNNPHVGIHVISEEDKVVLHCFLDGKYVHSQRLKPGVYYPAISADLIAESVAFVRPKEIPSIPEEHLLSWPVHPFNDEPY